MKGISLGNKLQVILVVAAVITVLMPNASCVAPPPQNITATVDNKNSLVVHIQGSVKASGK